MKIAVINEVSCAARNADIIRALGESTDAEILNVGMRQPEEDPQLTYIHTGYMAATLLFAQACDLVVGGCGTGQGFLNAVLQFPGVVCGLIGDPLDAWLFSQINSGNCISLPLNKGYGWAGDVNLRYLFEKLFADPAGHGYPVARAQSQAESRDTLKRISCATHRSMEEILERTDRDILQAIGKSGEFMKVLKEKNTETAAIFEAAGQWR